MRETTNNGPPRRPKWMLPAAICGVIFLACAGVLSIANVKPSVAGGELSADERLVKAKIIADAADSASVEIISWGPNDNNGEWNKLLKKYAANAGLPSSATANVGKVLRVRYRAKDRMGALQLYDVLAILVGNKIAIRRNDFGDRWLDQMRTSTNQHH